jgi:hypothetical protein
LVRKKIVFSAFVEIKEKDKLKKVKMDSNKIPFFSFSFLKRTKLD